MPSLSNQRGVEVATIGFLSAKGSPGVTTTVVAMACVWSRANPGRTALALDADPAGGDVAAGVLRGEAPPGAGVLSLATSRDAGWREAIHVAAVPLGSEGSAHIIPGVPDSARAPALALAWDVLAERRADLHDDGCDVLVDAGRVVLPGLPSQPRRSHRALADVAPWLAGSDVAVLVVRPGLPGVLAAHRIAADWPIADVPLRVLVAETPSPYRAPEVARAVGLPLIGILPHDPTAARVYSDGSSAPRGFARGSFARGTVRVAGAVGSLAVEMAQNALHASDADLDADRGASVVRRG